MSGASFMALLGVRPTFALSYRTSVADATDLSSYSFATVDIGTASTDRYVIVGVYATTGVATQTISAFTVGGISGTLLFDNSVSAGGQFSRIAFYAFPVPTGATATVAITWSNTQNRCAISTWAATGFSSLTPGATATSSSLTSASLNLNTTDGCGVLAIGHCNSSATYSWAGVTERSDVITETVGFTAADTTVVTGSTPLTVTGTITSGGATIANAIAIAIH